MKHRYIATLNGEEFARSTDRVYTHAVICKDQYPVKYIASKAPRRNWRRAAPGHFVREEGKPAISTEAWAQFCGSRDLAEKVAASQRNKGWVHVTIVPAREGK